MTRYSLNDLICPKCGPMNVRDVRIDGVSWSDWTQITHLPCGTKWEPSQKGNDPELSRKKP